MLQPWLLATKFAQRMAKLAYWSGRGMVPPESQYPLLIRQMTVCPWSEKERKSTPHVSAGLQPTATVAVIQPVAPPFVKWLRYSWGDGA